MARTHLKLVAPGTEKRTVVTPRRKTNAELRTREYLTDAEVPQPMETTKDNRYGHRDATMVLMAYRHGHRVSDFASAGLAVRRTSAGRRARTRSWVTSCGRFADFSGTRNPNHRLTGRFANYWCGPCTILVGLSSSAKLPLQLTFGLVGANMPSGLSLKIQACMS